MVSIESLQFHEDLLPAVTDRLLFIQNLYKLDKVRLNGNSLLIEGDLKSIETAKKLLPGFFLALKKKANKVITKVIKLSKSTEISMEEIIEIVGSEEAENVRIQLSDNISISGSNDYVSSCFDKINHFLSLLKDSKRKRTASGDAQNETDVFKVKHSLHSCMFCRANKSSRHFRKHCQEGCTDKTAKLFSFEERKEIVDAYYQ